MQWSGAWWVELMMQLVPFSWIFKTVSKGSCKGVNLFCSYTYLFLCTYLKLKLYNLLACCRYIGSACRVSHFNSEIVIGKSNKLRRSPFDISSEALDSSIYLPQPSTMKDPSSSWHIAMPWNQLVLTSTNQPMGQLAPTSYHDTLNSVSSRRVQHKRLLQIIFLIE